MISVADFLCGEIVFTAYLNDILPLAQCCINWDTPFLRSGNIFVSLSPTLLLHFSTTIIAVIA